jgi:hypothetical protein
MSKSEIIAELAHLSVEELADVRAVLDRLRYEKSAAKARTSPTHPRHIRTPRLADPVNAAEFTKQVIDIQSHAI